MHLGKKGCLEEMFHIIFCDYVSTHREQNRRKQGLDGRGLQEILFIRVSALSSPVAERTDHSSDLNAPGKMSNSNKRRRKNLHKFACVCVGFLQVL